MQEQGILLPDSSSSCLYLGPLENRPPPTLLAVKSQRSPKMRIGITGIPERLRNIRTPKFEPEALQPKLSLMFADYNSSGNNN